MGELGGKLSGRPPTVTVLVGEMEVDSEIFKNVLIQGTPDIESPPIDIEWTGCVVSDAWITKITPDGRCEFVPVRVNLENKDV